MSSYREMDEKHLGLRAHVLSSIMQLLREKKLEEISVGDICEKAGTSRATFYRLFSSKNDIFNWYMRVTLRASIEQVGVVFPWDQALLRFFRDMDANRELARCFFASEEKGNPTHILQRYIEGILRANVLQRFPDQEDISWRYGFQIEAFSVAFSHAVPRWLSTSNPPYVMVDLVCSIVPSELFSLLNTKIDGEPFNHSTLREGDYTPLVSFVSEFSWRNFPY